MNLLRMRYQSLTQGEARREILQMRGRRKHHDVRHAVIDERDGHLLGAAIGAVRRVTPDPALDRKLSTARFSDARCADTHEGSRLWSMQGSAWSVNATLARAPVTAPGTAARDRFKPPTIIA